MMLQYYFEKGLTLNRVRHFVSQEFTPPLLLNNLNLDGYAQKLSDFANFLLCKRNTDDIGFIAYYENHQDGVLYITLITVRRDCRHQGIGSALIEQLNDKYKGSNFKKIVLEVAKDNLNAYQFYLRLGFHEIEDRANKTLMEREI